MTDGKSGSRVIRAGRPTLCKSAATCSVANGRLAVVDLGNRLLQVVVVLFAQLGNAVLPVQPLPNHLVCLDELVDLAGQLVVLVADDADVVVHRVDLDLKIGVVLEQRYKDENGDLQRRIDQEGCQNVELSSAIKELEVKIRQKED